MIRILRATRKTREALRKLMNARDAVHELIVIVVSYAFIFAGAWNDGLLGFAPSLVSRIAEWLMALVLVAEVATRITFTERRGAGFWGLVALDLASVLTVLPGLVWFTFARVARMVYAAARLVGFLDRLAAQRDNGMYITGIFPFVVPLLAAVVYSIERHTRGSPVHNFLDALRMCFAFSLTLGNVRPVNDLKGHLRRTVPSRVADDRRPDEHDFGALSERAARHVASSFARCGKPGRGWRYLATRDSLSRRS